MRAGVVGEETDVGNNQRVVAHHTHTNSHTILEALHSPIKPYTGDRKATKALKILFRPLQS